MSEYISDIHTLKQNVFALIADSRKALAQGQVDLSPVEVAVRAYCDALAAMPLEEARLHTSDLETLSQGMNALERDLQSARNMVQQQLWEFGQLHKAHKAYQKSDGIGEKFFAQAEEEDEQ